MSILQRPHSQQFTKGFVGELQRQFQELVSWKSAALMVIGSTLLLTADLFLKGRVTQVLTRWNRPFFLGLGVFSAGHSASHALQGHYQESGRTAAQALLSFGMVLFFSPHSRPPPPPFLEDSFGFFGNGGVAFATVLVTIPGEVSLLRTLAVASSLPPGILLMSQEGEGAGTRLAGAKAYEANEQMAREALHTALTHYEEGQAQQGYYALCRALLYAVARDTLGLIEMALGRKSLVLKTLNEVQVWMRQVSELVTEGMKILRSKGLHNEEEKILELQAQLERVSSSITVEGIQQLKRQFEALPQVVQESLYPALNPIFAFFKRRLSPAVPVVRKPPPVRKLVPATAGRRPLPAAQEGGGLGGLLADDFSRIEGLMQAHLNPQGLSKLETLLGRARLWLNASRPSIAQEQLQTLRGRIQASGEHADELLAAIDELIAKVRKL